MSRPKDDSLTCLCLRKLLSTLRGLAAFPALATEWFSRLGQCPSVAAREG